MFIIHNIHICLIQQNIFVLLLQPPYHKLLFVATWTVLTAAAPQGYDYSAPEGGVSLQATGQRTQQQAIRLRGNDLQQIPSGQTIFLQTTPRPVSFQQTTARPDSFQQTSPSTVFFQQTSPRLTTFQQTSASPAFIQRTTPRPEFFQKTTLIPSSFQQTTPSPAIFLQTAASPVSFQQTSPSSTIFQQTTARPVSFPPTSPRITTFQQTSARPVSFQHTSPRPNTIQQTSARPVSFQRTSARPAAVQKTSARPVSFQQTSTRPILQQQTGTEFVQTQTGNQALGNFLISPTGAVFIDSNLDQRQQPLGTGRFQVSLGSGETNIGQGNFLIGGNVGIPLASTREANEIDSHSTGLQRLSGNLPTRFVGQQQFSGNINAAFNDQQLADGLLINQGSGFQSQGQFAGVGSEEFAPNLIDQQRTIGSLVEAERHVGQNNGFNVAGGDFRDGGLQETQFEPAKYNFEWDVNDPESGNFYGHQEERDGQLTRGR